MSATLAAAFLAAALLAQGSPALASGGRPGGIFEFAASGRTAGMAGAQAAMAEGAPALYHNPAGLGRVRGHEVSLTHAQLFEGAAFDNLGWAGQGRLGGWGVGLLRLNVGGIEGRDEFNEPSGGATYAETALSFGFGTSRFMDGRLSAGGSFKVLQRALGPASNRLIGADLGAQYRPELLGGRLALGLLASNLLSMKMGDTDDKLPFGARVGAAVRVLGGMSLEVNVTSEGEFEAGTEYLLGPAAFRAGFREMGPSFGAGFRFLKRWNADFAVISHSELGMSSLISLGYRFGQDRSERKLRGRFESAEKKAAGELESRNYLEAARLWEKAMAVNADGRDPSVADGRLRAARLKKLAESLELETRPKRVEALGEKSEQGRLGLEAVNAYLDGESRKAMLLAQAAHGTDAQNEAFRSLMAAIAALTFQKPASDEIYPSAGIVEVKMRKALASFKAGRYDEAAEECREALMLDPRSASARERLGSAYFALGLKDRALLEWREALKLDPRNEALKDFLRRMGETP